MYQFFRQKFFPDNPATTLAGARRYGCIVGGQPRSFAGALPIHDSDRTGQDLEMTAT